MRSVKIETERVPRPVRDDMARCLLEQVVEYFERPGVEEAFQVWLVGYQQRRAAKEKKGATYEPTEGKVPAPVSGPV